MKIKKEFKKNCDEIFDEINSELDNDEFPNLNLDYDEQLIEITNQDIQFAFDHSHLIDLMTERGQAISEGDLDEIEESNQAINKYI